MGILSWIVVGLIAGALTSLLMGSESSSIMGDVVLGIVGAIVGGFLAGAIFGLHDPVSRVESSTLMFAVFGSVVTLAVVRALTGRTPV